MRMLNSKKKISVDEIREIERVIGLSIPEDLKAFYLLHNGGRPEKCDYIKNDECYIIHTFFEMIPGEDSSGTGFCGIYIDLVLENDLFPDNVIPFADDPGGDFFVYSVGSKNYGAVCCVRSDYYEDPDRYVVVIANSFSEFADGLVDLEASGS